MGGAQLATLRGRLAEGLDQLGAALVLGLVVLEAEDLPDLVQAAGQAMGQGLDHRVLPALDRDVEPPDVPQH
ncbi:hypothetical protein B1145_08040, partial [Enterococcus faecium]